MRPTAWLTTPTPKTTFRAQTEQLKPQDGPPERYPEGDQSLTSISFRVVRPVRRPILDQLPHRGELGLFPDYEEVNIAGTTG